MKSQKPKIKSRKRAVCNETGKTIFASQTDAEQFISLNVAGATPFYPYRCVRCGYWHTTRQTAKSPRLY